MDTDADPDQLVSESGNRRNIFVLVIDSVDEDFNPEEGGIASNVSVSAEPVLVTLLSED